MELAQIFDKSDTYLLELSFCLFCHSSKFVPKNEEEIGSSVPQVLLCTKNNFNIKIITHIQEALVFGGYCSQVLIRMYYIEWLFQVTENCLLSPITRVILWKILHLPSLSSLQCLCSLRKKSNPCLFQVKENCPFSLSNTRDLCCGSFCVKFMSWLRDIVCHSNQSFKYGPQDGFSMHTKLRGKMQVSFLI